MSTELTEVYFLGGPLHGTKRELPTDCESYLHNRGLANEVTYVRSHRVGSPDDKSSTVFTTADHVIGLPQPEASLHGPSC